MQGTIKDEGLGSQIEAIRLSLAEIVGRQRYQIWFKNSARFTLCEPPEHASPGAGIASEVYLKISVPNSFMAGWIESHFRSEIDQAVLSATGSKKIGRAHV